MSRPAANALVIFVVSFAVGACSPKDPLTKYIRMHGYEPIFPPTSRITVGDIYESEELKGVPVELIDDILTPVQRDEMMAHAARDVSLMNSAKNSRYSLEGNVYALDSIDVELKNAGVSRYHVNTGNATEYLISRGYFNRIILPELLKRRSELQGAYVYRLLKVDRIEYEFYSETGGKIAVTPTHPIAAAFNAKAGSDWSVNERHNIEISQPRFIGFKAQRFATVQKKTGRDDETATQQYTGHIDVATLEAQLREIYSDSVAASMIKRDLPRIKGGVTASEFIRILDAASIYSDSEYTSVVVACAKNISGSITPSQTRDILDDIYSDTMQTRAAAALTSSK